MSKLNRTVTPYLYERKSRSHRLKQLIQIAHEKPRWRWVLIALAIIWICTLACFFLFPLAQPFFLPINIIVGLIGLVLLIDTVQDAFIRARVLDHFDAAREAAEDRELTSKLQHEGVHPERVEKRLKRGDTYHFGNDGEIVFDEVPEKPKRKER